ncbi:hypothetical protein Pcar_2190 [Syntrophotalea carbinolica DSM 2380]|uniref:Uncharacterized protein n=1 Tax=Syntrophotalea carbinolica (strain DSM 2380 / NBRC 103641 / GraBd1) TaxID=338963 RepID=Q3A2H8_SYNC1|nr:hypothetical protein Pcar_2190 [Syntrophotalea carbinolica DSM 2380]
MLSGADRLISPGKSHYKTGCFIFIDFAGRPGQRDKRSQENNESGFDGWQPVSNAALETLLRQGDESGKTIKRNEPALLC